ncbi:hypothetical protein ARMSODRAFT_68575 [Armillaria solidipes]|uniref:Uncharacterized protein n=1 Tax=Armillaria solidipes TaxID=1076256 RepID=A0A2H3C548_9AGAR|nr:hypothetical protein ARMSODRAFT_68575 [Armillaria solidipes]
MYMGQAIYLVVTLKVKGRPRKPVTRKAVNQHQPQHLQYRSRTLSSSIFLCTLIRTRDECSGAMNSPAMRGIRQRKGAYIQKSTANTSRFATKSATVWAVWLHVVLNVGRDSLPKGTSRPEDRWEESSGGRDEARAGPGDHRSTRTTNLRNITAVIVPHRLQLAVMQNFDSCVQGVRQQRGHIAGCWFHNARFDEADRPVSTANPV